MNPLKLFVFIILFNVICGSYETSDQNRKLLQLIQQRSDEYDDQYVWFTRDIHDQNTSFNREQMLVKKWYELLFRKHSKA
jgi:hypothetical protein